MYLCLIQRSCKKKYLVSLDIKKIITCRQDVIVEIMTAQMVMHASLNLNISAKILNI